MRCSGVLARLSRQLEVVEPLHVGVARATRDDQAPGRTVLDGERLAVQLVANKTVLPLPLGEGGR